MNIQDIIKSGASITLSVEAKELADFAQSIVEQTRRDLAQELAAQNDEAYYSPEKVCALLDIDRTTLYRWNKIGYLPNIEIGALRRYRKSDIDNLLQKRTTI